jgi:hypothetical protein
MPKWLVIGAIIAVLLVVALLSWLNKRSLQDNGEPAAAQEAPVATVQKSAPPVAPVAQGPVVLTPKEPVWLQVYEKGGTTYYSGILNPGQNFTVPADAKAPLLKTGKPEGLTITVGSAVAPMVGPAGKMASDVSLIGTDLIKGGTAPAPAVTAATGPTPGAAVSTPQRRPARAKPSSRTQAPAPSPQPALPAPDTAGNTAGG